MKLNWFPKDIRNDTEAKAKFKEAVVRAQPVLTQLETVVDEFIKELERPSTDFNSPNWALEQASYVGQLTAYYRIKDLLKGVDNA